MQRLLHRMGITVWKGVMRMPPGRGLGPRGFLTDEEKQNLPVVNGSLLKRILSYLTPYWPQFLLVFVTILVSSVLGLLPSVITGKIVDEALVGKESGAAGAPAAGGLCHTDSLPGYFRAGELY